MTSSAAPAADWFTIPWTSRKARVTAASGTVPMLPAEVAEPDGQAVDQYCVDIFRCTLCGVSQRQRFFDGLPVVWPVAAMPCDTRGQLGVIAHHRCGDVCDASG